MERTVEVTVRVPMMVGAHIVLIVIRVSDLTVLIVLMVMGRTKVTRRMVMNGVGVEPENQTMAVMRRRTGKRVSTALARKLAIVKNVWDDIRVLLVFATRFFMTKFVIFVKTMGWTFITPQASVGSRKVGT